MSWYGSAIPRRSRFTWSESLVPSRRRTDCGGGALYSFGFVFIVASLHGDPALHDAEQVVVVSLGRFGDEGAHFGVAHPAFAERSVNQPENGESVAVLADQLDLDLGILGGAHLASWYKVATSYTSST